MVFGKFDRFGKGIRGVLIVAKNKGNVKFNPIPAQIGQSLLKSPFHGVEAFVHRFQVFGVETLKAN